MLYKFFEQHITCEKKSPQLGAFCEDGTESASFWNKSILSVYSTVPSVLQPSNTYGP